MQDITYTATIDMSADQPRFGFGESGINLPATLIGNQSFILDCFLDVTSGGADFDITGASGTLSIKLDDSSETPILLAAGAIVGAGTLGNMKFTVPKDVLPNSLGQFDQSDRLRQIRIFADISDGDSRIQIADVITILPSDASGPGAGEPDVNTLADWYQESDGSPDTADKPTPGSGKKGIAFGLNSNQTRLGEFAYGYGNINTHGDVKEGKLGYLGETPDATPLELFLQGAAERLAMVSGSSISFRAEIVAKQSGVASTKHWTFTGSITDTAGTATLNKTTKRLNYESAAATSWDVAFGSTTNNLTLTVTGEAAKTIRWGITTYFEEVA